MKWINCADNCPDVIHENIIIRNAKTKGIIENGYFRSYANKSKNAEWALNNFEWLDESELSFSISDIILTWAKAQGITIENTSYDRAEGVIDPDYSYIEKERNEFFKKQFNIDLTK